MLPDANDPPTPRASGAWTPERRRGVFWTVVRVALFVVFGLPMLGFVAIVLLEELDELQRHWARMAALRSIAEAQETFRQRAFVDTDRDGVGEYGTLLELAGRGGVRQAASGATSPDHALPKTLLSPRFRTYFALRRGLLGADGFLFKVFLPGRGGVGVAESASSDCALDAPVDPAAAETAWCAYAWKDFPTSESRVYFMNAAGEVYVSEIEEGSYGRWGTPPPGAALTSGGLDCMTGAPADGVVAQDGHVWTRVE